MALFDTGIHSNQVATAVMTEVALKELGFSPEVSRRNIDGASHAWQANDVVVTISASDDNPVMRLERNVRMLPPDAPASTLRTLLAHNFSSMRGVAYALDGDKVVLVAERPTMDLDQSEVATLLEQLLNMPPLPQ